MQNNYLLKNYKLNPFLPRTFRAWPHIRYRLKRIVDLYKKHKTALWCRYNVNKHFYLSCKINKISEYAQCYDTKKIHGCQWFFSFINANIYFVNLEICAWVELNLPGSSAATRFNVYLKQSNVESGFHTRPKKIK